MSKDQESQRVEPVLVVLFLALIIISASLIAGVMILVDWIWPGYGIIPLVLVALLALGGTRKSDLPQP